MVKIIKEAYPYFVMQDDTMIDQYCVMVKNWLWFFHNKLVLGIFAKVMQYASMTKFYKSAQTKF